MPVWGRLASVVKFYQCKIAFSGSSRPTKRDNIPLGYLGGEPYYSIERVEETERTVVVPLGWDGHELRESWMATDNEDPGNGEPYSKRSE
ncbi:uncharacterized protein BDW70DRAFT_160784 [Aspergillus foveolatus]|uniref:uncharacterized protein n=1 Tax=Aspergillus foveolatus TaxID=210207 RepID=UPI003CCE4CAF